MQQVPLTPSDCEMLSRVWFPSLNNGKILGIQWDFDGSASPIAGRHGNNVIEPVNFKDLDLGTFPLVEDLYLSLESSLDSFGEGEIYGNLNLILRFRSFEYGSPKDLASIELYGADIAYELDRIARNNFLIGTFENPYEDAEQGWRFYCFEKDEFIYILYGIDISTIYFPVWFKVKKTHYLNLFEGLQKAWKQHRKNLFEAKIKNISLGLWRLYRYLRP